MILSVILAVGAIPVPVKASSAKVENYVDIPAPELNIQLDNLLAGNQPRVIEIVVTESEAQRKERESEAALPDILKKIRSCESGNNYQAQNPRSTAGGAFQIINGTWDNYAGYARAKDAPPIIQNEKAMLIYSTRGTQPWNASKHCWSPNIAPISANLTVNSGTQYGTATIIGVDTQYLNCVPYAKAMSGIHKPIGNGGRSAVQGTEPKVGSIGVMKGRPHAVYVVAISGDMITLHESNYHRGYITQRTVPLSQFIGFIYS